MQTTPFDAIAPRRWVCTMCEREYVPKDPRRNKGVICGAWECGSALASANGAAGRDRKQQRTPRRISPVASAHRTILQPQIADYIASLAAANTSMVGVGA